MNRLITFELEKILLHRKLVWAALAGFVLFMAIMQMNWVLPNGTYVQYMEDGDFHIVRGQDAISYTKELAGKYAGPLTTEKVKDVLASGFWSRDEMIAANMDPESLRYFVHNALYDAFLGSFARPDGTYNGSTVEEIYGPRASELVIGYFSGWGSTMFSLSNLMLVWCCIVIIILSSIFSDEYTRGTDALILSSIHGRTKCSLAKIIASFVVSIGGTVLIILALTLVMLLFHGTDGYEASVQINNIWFLSTTPYPLSWLKAYFFACIFWITAIIIVTAVTLLVSALAKSSFSSLVISLSIYLIPAFFPWNEFGLDYFGSFMPINQVMLNSFSLAEIPLGTYTLNLVWLTIPVSLILLVLCGLGSGKTFSGHQVE